MSQTIEYLNIFSLTMVWFPFFYNVTVKNRFFQFHFYLVPLQPGQITASNVQSSSLTLAWTLPDPSPGNTTYTIYTYEGTDDKGISFSMNKSTKVYGMYQFLVVIRIEFISNIVSKI